MPTRFSLLLVLLAMSFLTGCATLNQRDRNMLGQHQVSPDLYDRMLHKEPLALSDIIELTRKQLPPRFLIDYLDSTRAVYHLTRSDVLRLKKAGVNQDVIDYLLDTTPMYAPQPYYYYSPVYDPWPGSYYYPDYYYRRGPTVIIHDPGWGFHGGGYWGHHRWH